MTERTHALEYWLRLAANNAIRAILDTPPDGTVQLDALLARTIAQVRAAMDEGAGCCTTSNALLQTEAALGYLLRAVAMLQREEAGR